MSYSVTLKCNILLHLRYSVNLMVIFNGAANNSVHITSNVLMPVSDELETAWKEVVVAWFKVLSRRFLVELKKTTVPTINNISVEILPWHLQNTSYRLGKVAWRGVIVFCGSFVTACLRILFGPVNLSSQNPLSPYIAVNVLNHVQYMWTFCGSFVTACLRILFAPFNLSSQNPLSPYIAVNVLNHAQYMWTFSGPSVRCEPPKFVVRDKQLSLDNGGSGYVWRRSVPICIWLHWCLVTSIRNTTNDISGS